MSKTSEAAQKLLDMIQSHRAAFDMPNWAGYSGYLVKQNYQDDSLPMIGLENIEEGNTACGTTLCIAGFAALATDWKQKFVKSSVAGVIYAKMVSPEGKVVANPDYVKIGADFLDLPHELAADLFLTTDNETALELLEQLANGVDPESILEPMYNECNCPACRPYKDDEY